MFFVCFKNFKFSLKTRDISLLILLKIWFFGHWNSSWQNPTPLWPFTSIQKFKFRFKSSKDCTCTHSVHIFASFLEVVAINLFYRCKIECYWLCYCFKFFFHVAFLHFQHKTDIYESINFGCFWLLLQFFFLLVFSSFFLFVLCCLSMHIIAIWFAADWYYRSWITQICIRICTGFWGWSSFIDYRVVFAIIFHRMQWEYE